VSAIDLGRRRDLGALLGDALRVYTRNFAAFFVISAAIVVPVQAIVGGFGLDQFTSAYEESPSVAEAAIPTVVGFLVTAPLVTAASIYALRDLAVGERARAGRSLTEAMEAFAPIFFAVVLAAAGIALGLLLLLIPGIYVAVRWYFVPQAVVLEGTGGPEALSASGRTVEGSWWRTLGVVIVANLAAAIPGLLLIGPFTELASSSDRQVWALVGETAAEIITTPFVALVSTLLWFDLRTRRRA
jgi:hypothetical protein